MADSVELGGGPSDHQHRSLSNETAWMKLVEDQAARELILSLDAGPVRISREQAGREAVCSDSGCPGGTEVLKISAATIQKC